MWTLSDFGKEIRQLMFDGVGNSGHQWTIKAVAKNIEVSEPTVRRYTDGRSFPNLQQRQKFDRLFFPDTNLQNDPVFKKYCQIWKAEHEQRQAERKKAAAWIDKKTYSPRDLWGKLIASKSDEFSVLVSGSNPDTKFGGFKPSEIEIKNSGSKFFVDYPQSLRAAVASQEIAYDLHASEPVYLGKSLGDFAQYFPEGFLEEKIEHYAELYARQVLKAFNRPSGTKPYNKLKFGVLGVASRKTKGDTENDIAEITVYETDFFTNWVMSRVYEEIRRNNLDILQKMEMFPSFNIGYEKVGLPILAPSLGLNCAIISAPSGRVPSMLFTRLNNSSSNFVQHKKIHLPVNEGMNLEDLIPGTDRVSLDTLYRRMLEEEVGSKKLGNDSYETLCIFLDKSVGEVGIFGVIQTDLRVEELNRSRKAARDYQREFGGEDYIELAATESGIANFILAQPNSVNNFVTYTPHLIDYMFTRNVFSKFSV